MAEKKNSSYWNAVRALHRNRSHFAKLLKEPALSHGERTLLSARRLVADHRWREAVALLERSAPGEILLRAEREFLLAEALNRLARNTEALRAAQRAIPLYRELGDYPGTFQGLLSVAINLHVQGWLPEARALLDELQPLANTPLQKHLIFRETAFCRLKQEELSKLGPVLARLKEEKEGFPARHRQITDQVIGYMLMVSGDLRAAQDRFDHCIEAYPRLSRLTARFWSRLIRLLTQEHTIPPPDAIIRRSPSFLSRYECLRELQGGSPERARAHWKALQAQAPKVYGDPFEFKQSWVARNAFGLLVERYQPQTALGPTRTPEHPLEDRLIDILRASKSPVSKARLIELLYRQPYEISLDSRFYKLIERVKKRGLRIFARAGAYRLG